MKPNPNKTLRTGAALLAALTLLQAVTAQTTPPASGEKKNDTLVMEAFVTTGSTSSGSIRKTRCR
jgi:hypothetical protein